MACPCAGTLFSIDPDQATISLKDGAWVEEGACGVCAPRRPHPYTGPLRSSSCPTVRAHGTEGRETTGAKIPPSVDTFGFIVFKGADIKDLSVIEGDAAPAAPAPAPAAPAPAPVPAPAPAGYGMVTPTAHVVVEPATPAHPQPRPRYAPRDDAYGGGGGGGRRGGGGNGPRGPPQPRGPPAYSAPRPAASAAPVVLPEAPEGEFDFAGALETFEKKKQEAAASRVSLGGEEPVPEVAPVAKAYDKSSSFFDNLSSRGVRGGAAPGPRPSFRSQVDVNTETFGEAAATAGRRGGRGRGGGGGGGRRGGGGGGGRGGGRGGFGGVPS